MPSVPSAIIWRITEERSEVRRKLEKLDNEIVPFAGRLLVRRADVYRAAAQTI